jgi:uncharacterized coiled-coil protein SlyX
MNNIIDIRDRIKFLQSRLAQQCYLSEELSRQLDDVNYEIDCLKQELEDIRENPDIDIPDMRY